MYGEIGFQDRSVDIKERKTTSLDPEWRGAGSMKCEAQGIEWFQGTKAAQKGQSDC